MTWWDFQGHQHEGPAPEHDMTNGQDMDYSAVDDDTPYERPKRKPGTWTTKDGRVVRIQDMGNQHLANTIRMLRRRAEAGRAKVELDLCSFAASCRGDAATDAAESEERMVARMGPDDFCGYFFGAVWHELVEEAERRKHKVAHDNSKVRVTLKTIIQNLRKSRLGT